MESYLYININTGKWLQFGRGAEPIPQWMKLLVSDSVPEIKLSPFRCEVALWDGWEEGGIQHVWFYPVDSNARRRDSADSTESARIIGDDWIFTSERHGDRFKVWMTFGDNMPRKIAGRRTSGGYAMAPLDTWRTVEAGEILMAHPPDYHVEE